ncbi:elongator complex protein 5-like [Gigantopelta aegis]|uniref:elongator complex protein 5-like n=1 Tax=Gigantopelta aegis TaxID=1735272 RepID=UPI001B887550|nr:elongator complex protein 5-like [Gigantopelta aegis]
MLKELCNGTESSKCVLIQDGAEQCGRTVFLTFITGLLQRVDRVVLFCWEKPASYYRARITSKLSDRVDLIDCTEDPVSWLDLDSPTVDSNLTDLVRERLTAADKKCVVAIDSLSFLLLHRGAPYTCQALHTLKSCKSATGCVVEQVISLVHGNLHNDHDLRKLEHVSSSVVRVTSPPDQQHDMFCSVVHRRISGKVIKTTELVKLDGLNILSTQNWQHDSVKRSPEQAESIDPAANLTFNLTLSENEKEARRQLVLPYTKEQRRQPRIQSSVSSMIYYEPDKADDFDEEDPDDDLDI